MGAQAVADSPNARLAQQLAQFGLAVFPCGPDKKPLCKWRDVSTNDPLRIEAIWRDFPDAPPGVDCGKSGLAVVDVDRHEGAENGCAKFAAMEALHGRVDAPRITTPSGGFHLYFRQPADGAPVTNSRGMLPLGIDVRGDGGYVVAAGAVLPDGRKYAPAPGSRRLSDVLSNGGLTPINGWLLDLIRPTPKHQERQSPPRRETNGGTYARVALERECEAVARAGNGGRNEQLNRSAFSIGQLVGGGELREHEVIDALMAAAMQCGLPCAEAKKTINSGLEKGKGSPRGRPVDEREHFTRDADHERDDATAPTSRKSFPVPRRDDERAPIMVLLDDVLLTDEPIPPMRDLDGIPIALTVREPYGLHELSSDGANEGEDKTSRLPAPAQHMLVHHDACSLALLIEQHVEFYKESKKKDDPPDSEPQRSPVALPSVFIDFYLKHRASRLPRVGAVMTLPVVLPSGELLATNGLHRRRKVAFCIEPALVAIMPQRPVLQAEVRAALAFLVDEWLVDVATDFTGKCTIVALALSCLERLILPERPAFFVTAGRRGGGKTTALNMVALALTGSRAAATAWSPDPEERRKALLPLLRQNLPLIVFDNIKRGALISCPNLEKVLTGETYEDRVLGESRTERASAATIITFTGNNIAPRGDLASRSLQIKLDVDRPDPENRSFVHPDPFEWTLENRGKILAALYTLLLGNPGLAARGGQFKGRFKVWQRIVGAAVEHAADLYGQPIDFPQMFLTAEADDDESAGNATVLKALDALSPDGAPFRSGDVVAYLKENENGDHAQAMRGFIDARLQGVPHPRIITTKMKTILDGPLWIDGEVWILRARNRSDNALDFWIEKKRDPNNAETML